MSNFPDATQLLGEAPPTISFKEIGDMVRGTIRNMNVTQRRRFMPDGSVGEPLFYSDGSPQLQIVITLETGTGGDADPHDGLRRLFVHGQMQSAIKQAVKDAGRAAPSVGSFLKVTFVKEEPSKGGGNDKKIYEAVYVPQDNGARTNDPGREVAHQEALQGQGF